MNAIPSLDAFQASDLLVSRFREAGDLTLDHFHHDGRVEDIWLQLNRWEFAMLWRLAEQPGQPVSSPDLAMAIGRTHDALAERRLARVAARLQERLASLGLGQLVVVLPDGGYVLAASPGAPSL